MKNILIVDIDTEREKRILLGKPNSVTAPENEQQAQEIIKNDIASLSEALIYIIDVAAQNNFINKDLITEACITNLKNTITTSEETM